MAVCLTESFGKHEKHCAKQEAEAYEIAPVKSFFHNQYGKDGKYNQGHHFLDYFQLKQIEPMARSQPVGRYSQAIFY